MCLTKKKKKKKKPHINQRIWEKRDENQMSWNGVK